MSAVVVAVLLAACSTGSDSKPVSLAVVPGTPTYYADILPIVEEHCTKCHYTGGIGPFPLTSFADVHAMADAMVEATATRAMPPWGAQDSVECTPPFPWRDDERLTLDQIDSIRRWAGGGAPAGDPASVPPALDSSAANNDVALANPDFDLAPHAPYTPSTSEQDDFHCFVLDTPAALALGGYVSAIDVVPGERAIVHHANVYSDVGGTSVARAGPNGDFDCPGGEILAPTADGKQPELGWLMAWAPGARALTLPDDLGIYLPPKAKIVVEVHYSTANKVVGPDMTHVQLSLRASKPAYTLSSWALGNAGPAGLSGDGLQPGPDDRGVIEFRIPAGAKSHTETEVLTFKVTQPIAIYGVRGHAHLAADDIKVDVMRAGSTEDDCLLQDKWDFHWQRVYSYDAPVNALPTVNNGDRVRVRCTYDNTMNNPRLGEELYERGMQPMDIFFGDDTLDEMCLAELLYVTKTP